MSSRCMPRAQVIEKEMSLEADFRDSSCRFLEAPRVVVGPGSYMQLRWTGIPTFYGFGVGQYRATSVSRPN
jgi:hypothetical protein